ncbi:LysR family transcriptional regulator [Ramlibacter sp. AW1]|uniref:LysR family transcriptional regulator n=1 Tax=Ramlibacter aurantiacus TaxID=2801330 RepID=A0A937D5M9_9BURK|nr:LysR family transcriptional regulator [Ramlibacter aurantiacus]MBL0421477.1 LysR family transcriptional regulator [Ramlibacter aurantiacus]
MRTVQYENTDLNLLLVFEALMAERNVTSAAHALGLTQPTLSHALNRLRKMCADELFVRTSRGMQPTAHAQEMAEPVRAALELIRGTLERRDSFEPSQARRLFKVLLTDIGTVNFLPALIAHLQVHAPDVQLETVQWPIDQYKTALQEGAVDLAIGQMPPIEAGFYQQRIFEDEFVCVVGADHPRIRDKPTLEQYLHERHVRVSLPGRPYSAVDEALSDMNCSRQVMVTVSQYLALLPILSATHLVAAVPYRVYLAMRGSGNIRMYPLPYPAPRVVVRQFWHARKHADPGLVWLRGVISELFAPEPEAISSAV